MTKNRPDETPDVPFGYSCIGFWDTRAEAAARKQTWRRAHPKMKLLITHNKKDKKFTLWKKTTKSMSKIGWRTVKVR